MKGLENPRAVTSGPGLDTGVRKGIRKPVEAFLCRTDTIREEVGWSRRGCPSPDQAILIDSKGNMSFLSKPTLPSPNLFLMPQITQSRAPGNQRPCPEPKAIENYPNCSPPTLARVLTPPHPLHPKKTPITAPGHALPSRFFPLLTSSGPSPCGPAWHGIPGAAREAP